MNLINELSLSQSSSGANVRLLRISEVGQWPCAFYDQNGDGSCTAMDALRLINDLARARAAAGEGEAVTPYYLSQSPSKVWKTVAETEDEQFQSEFQDSVLLYSDAELETPGHSQLPENPVHAVVRQESTEAVDSLLSDAEEWWK